MHRYIKQVYGIGKILVMDIVVMMNYWVKENNVIAMTSNVEL